MLVGKHGCRHQHRHLLPVGRRLERSPDRHLRLSESHVSADEPVHRPLALHVVLHVDGGFELVGRVLINERRLQFILHIGVL